MFNNILRCLCLTIFSPVFQWDWDLKQGLTSRKLTSIELSWICSLGKLIVHRWKLFELCLIEHEREKHFRTFIDLTVVATHLLGFELFPWDFPSPFRFESLIFESVSLPSISLPSASSHKSSGSISLRSFTIIGSEKREIVFIRQIA